VYDSSFRSYAAADVQGSAPGNPGDDVRRARATLPPPHPSMPSPGLGLWTAHVRYERLRDGATRANLFDAYADHARGLARAMYRGGEPMEELEQVAYTALLSALARFETRRRKPFPAFARPTIMGYLKRHYRDQGWALRIPRRLHEVTIAAGRAGDRLTQELAHQPEPAMLADELSIDEDLVREAAVATKQRVLVAMDAPVGGTDALDGWSQFGHLDPNLIGAADRIVLAGALAEMSATDRRLVGMYFFEEMTQRQIGARLGVSQMQVSRELNRIILRLRRQLGA
jgi:RNA polymerase sigma-B factor